MTTQHLIISDKTFQTIKSAVNKMVDMIRPTFGPASNKVIIDKQLYRMVVDDGVQIARDFQLDDPAENAVVKIVRETLVKTNDRAGDGTTGAGIMLQAIINEAARKTKVDGRKIEIELKRGLEEVKSYLTKRAKHIETKEELLKVARISFDNPEIAEMIADLYFKLGKDALITIDRSPTLKTTVETTDGINIARGYISPYMVNNGERLECVLEKPYILLTDYRLTENSDIMPIMEKMAAKQMKNLVVIAENVEQNALTTMVINLPQVMNPQTRAPGTFPAVAINLPKVENRDVLLEDLAMLTGAKVFSHDKGSKLEDAVIEDLGRAEKIIVKREDTTIVSPGGNKIDIAMAISSLRLNIDSESDEKKKADLKHRLAMFGNSLAVIKVGAPTENEQKALKYKVEDCVNAVKSAYQHGVVCGSGLALSRIKTSSPILNEALKYPARQLRENMGLDGEQDLKVDEALNVVTGEVGRFMDVGVMDPVDVLLAGVESAVSIACVLLTSTGMIVEHQKTDA
jgi:chaperonin GroEL